MLKSVSSGRMVNQYSGASHASGKSGPNSGPEE